MKRSTKHRASKPRKRAPRTVRPEPAVQVGTTYARVLHDSLTHKNRSFVFAILPCGPVEAVLSIRQGKNRDVYAVCEERRDRERRRVFVVANCKTGSVYATRVPSTVGLVGHCSCSGFGRWQNCKHHDALSDLVQTCSLVPLSQEAEDTYESEEERKQ